MRRSPPPAVDDQQSGRAYRRDATTWRAFAALFAFGVLNAMLGAVLPYLREIEHVTYVTAALHQVAFAVGGMAAGLLATRTTARRRRTIVAGLTGAASAGLLLGYGGVFPLTIIAALLVSAFATTALIRLWALLADLHHVHRPVAMTEGEVAVSLAGIVTPAVVSACAATWVSWRFSFVIAFVLVIAAATAIATTRLPTPGRPPTNATPETAAAHSPRRTLVTIFAVVGLEFTLSFWAASYLHDDVGMPQTTAVAMISTLYAANLVGRLLVSRLTRKLTVTTTLHLSLATALAGMPLLLTATNAVTAGAGLAVTGIGIGGTFPLASSLHVAASSRTADQALGQTLTVAGIGQIVGPLAAGALAQTTGLRLALLVLPALTILAALGARSTPHDPTNSVREPSAPANPDGAPGTIGQGPDGTERVIEPE
ncbi:MFS transporter [Actinophytocola sp.]|uniref:MFS transporter n=1 Tax=Actinophytocola sp. TaxID=1872138 RepID=UPI00389AD171